MTVLGCMGMDQESVDLNAYLALECKLLKISHYFGVTF